MTDLARGVRPRGRRARARRSSASRRSSTRPYFCQVQEPEHYRWAEPVPEDPTIVRMRELAREHRHGDRRAGLRGRAVGPYYNTAAVIDADGSYLGKYRKHHIPQVKGFWEKYYFKPGNLGWPVFDTAFGKVGVYICYDRHFPEGWRSARPRRRRVGLQPIGHPRAGCPPTCGSWSSPPRAVANEYFVAAINRVGHRSSYGDNDFYGTSYFVDPRGQFVGDVASNKRGGTPGTRPGLREDRSRSVSSWAFYRDRRPEAYGPADRGLRKGRGRRER